MIEHGQPGAVRHSREHRIDDLLRATGWARDVRHHDAGPAAGGHIVGHVAASVVAVIGQQQFVARRQGQSRSTQLTAAVTLETKTTSAGSAPIRSQSACRDWSSSGWILPREEPHRLAFHFGPQPLLGVEDRQRTCPERAVIEHRHGGVEAPRRGMNGKRTAVGIRLESSG